MNDEKFEAHLNEGKNYVVGLLKNKTTLKLDVYQNTIEWFKKFKEELNAALDLVREEIDDDRIRLKVVDRGDTEAQLFIGSDAIIFTMHTNVFQLSKNDYSSQTSYVRNNPSNAYCGIINIYNFLADSYEFNRSHDLGYLIGRMFINKENHFLVEGKGQLGMIYRDFMHQELSRKIIRDIILRVSIHAIDFDLYTPPYNAVHKVTVQDLNTMNYSSKLKTGKRLGFKFESQQDIT